MLGSLFRDERRAIQATAWGTWPGDPGPGGWQGANTWAGQQVTTQNSLQLLTVYGCNRFICEGIATLPIDVYTATGDVPIEVAKPRWLLEPTPELDVVAWLTQILTSLLLAGNAYLMRDYDGASGGPRYLIPLDPTTVQVRRDRGKKTFTIAGRDYTSLEVLHIPGVMFPGSDTGLSPVEAARQSVGLGMALQESGAKFFGQGMNLGGVIEDPSPVDADKAKATARIFGRLHGGNRNAHLPAVLMGGMSWKATGVTNEQAQFLQSRGFTASEIAAFMFLIDPSEFAVFMGQGGSITYANLEQRNQRKVQVTFMPWMVRLEKALSAEMSKPRYMKFNADALLRGDIDTRYKAHAVGIQNHFLYPNEARALEDMPPIDGGDTFPPPVAAKV